MWGKFLALLSGRSRIEKLIAARATVELAALVHSRPVLVVSTNLGYGMEYWALSSEDLQTRRDVRAFVYGKLITSDGKAASKSAVTALGYDIKEVAIRY